MRRFLLLRVLRSRRFAAVYARRGGENMTQRSLRSLLLLAGVLALGCPRPAPPIRDGVQCKQSTDGGLGTATLNWGADSLVVINPTTAGAPTSTVISIGGQPYLSLDVTVDRATNLRTATVHFGKAFSGMREMALTTVDGETFSGTLDGKALKPFVKTATPDAFADGSPMPAVSVDENAQKELKSFFKAMEDAPDACKKELTKAPARPVFGEAVSGHGYNRVAQIPCLECWMGICMVAITGCETGVILACAQTGNPIAAGICAGIGTIACLGAEEVCVDKVCGLFPPSNEPPGSACCPVSCGPNQGCCPEGETCLPHGRGLHTSMDAVCCPHDHPQPCGSVCCLQSDRCDQSTCFPQCGGFYCAAGETCTNNVCCAPGRAVCNGVCCALNATCHPVTGNCCPVVCGKSCCNEFDSTCVNQATSTCCQNAHKCGSICCPSNQFCSDPIKQICSTCTNCPPERDCHNGICCPAGYYWDPPTNACHPPIQ